MTFTTRIKNCGLMSRVETDIATLSGASFLGFVYCESSPRHLSLEAIGNLAAHTQEHVGRVLVCVRPDDALLERIADIATVSHLQVHGVTDSSRLHHIAGLSHKKLIAGVSITSAEDLHYAYALETVADHVLLDSKSDSHGGSGLAFDWRVLEGATMRKPWFLAGGLTCENVREALRITHAPMVDVSSGIESAPGEKSLEKIANFNAAVLDTPIC